VRRAGCLAFGCLLAGCAPMSDGEYSKYIDSLLLSRRSVEAAIQRLEGEGFACHDGSLGFLRTALTREPVKSCFRDGSTLIFGCGQFVMIEYDASTRAVRHVSEMQACASF
jgi:hypothetical protein